MQPPKDLSTLSFGWELVERSSVLDSGLQSCLGVFSTRSYSFRVKIRDPKSSRSSVSSGSGFTRLLEFKQAASR